MSAPQRVAARPAKYKNHWLAGAALTLLVAPAGAGTLTLQVTLPAIDTASYYRPYLAAWVEKAEEDKAVLGTLAVWYDTRLRDNGGRGWLRNLRTWWRSSGEQMALPADGVSGATRPAGTHLLQFSDAKGLLSKLPAGQYQLAIEVARENGGREMLRLPFTWGRSASQADAQGRTELGKVNVVAVP
ncbi:DUF2271 domain-containing protein [Ottowia thiooxydans]|uniref:DUF2271 domain-containing protein n=1 Tax=Ottowia thiooxydans TaxID=219182 RepID=UPI000407ECEB|nr:DUF2271 domain-containing protein [Ottowia thiooxydans]